MINTGPSNDKIYQRCVALISTEVIMKSWGARIPKNPSDLWMLRRDEAANIPEIRGRCSLKGAAENSDYVNVSFRVAIELLAELCLLKAIHKSDEISQEQLREPISSHVRAFLTNGSQSGGNVTVLPVAFLLAVSANPLRDQQQAMRFVPYSYSTAVAKLEDEFEISKMLCSILEN
jgi:hypothetical protein